jgi:hypothetical protein
VDRDRHFEIGGRAEDMASVPLRERHLTTGQIA